MAMHGTHTTPHHTTTSARSQCQPLTHHTWGHAQGPKDTPFENGKFELVINVPEQYPLVPPNVRFKTKMFHPNVHFKVSCQQL